MIACTRCSKLGELEVRDADGDLLEVETVDADGLLLYVCPECMTDAEAVEKARRSAAALLDAAEEAMANHDMIFERVPGMRENPEAKAAYAEAQRHAEEARATLSALGDV